MGDTMTIYLFGSIFQLVQLSSSEPEFVEIQPYL